MEDLSGGSELNIPLIGSTATWITVKADFVGITYVYVTRYSIRFGASCEELLGETGIQTDLRDPDSGEVER